MSSPEPSLSTQSGQPGPSSPGSEGAALATAHRGQQGPRPGSCVAEVVGALV